jgi:hypothetical protein
MSEFADQAAAAADEAYRKTLLGQQGLSAQLAGLGLQGAQAGLEDALRRFGIGAQLGTDTMRIAAQREGLGYQAASDALARAAAREGLGYQGMEGALRQAAAREALGAQIIPEAFRTGVARMDPLLRLAQAGMQGELSGMQLGAGLLDQFNRGRMAASTGAQDLLGRQMTAALQGGTLYRDILGAQGTLGGNILQAILAGPRLGLDIGTAITGAIRQANPYDLASRWASDWYGRSQGSLLQLYSPWMQAYSGALGDATKIGMPSGIQPEQKWWTPIGQAAGQALGGVLGTRLGGSRGSAQVQLSNPWEAPPPGYGSVIPSWEP